MITLSKDELSMFDRVIAFANDEINDLLSGEIPAEELSEEIATFSLLKKIRSQCVEW